MRPQVPEPVEAVIEAETSTAAATTEKSKSLMEKFLEKLSNPK